jgi:hypothetical protein
MGTRCRERPIVVPDTQPVNTDRIAGLQATI